jgi:hypothetical protein
MVVFPEIFWSSHEISFIGKQESAREDRSLKAESAQMCYLFEGMTWDALAFSSERGKCGVKGQ